jgi:hypothetical protein
MTGADFCRRIGSVDGRVLTRWCDLSAGWEVNSPDVVYPRHFSMDLDHGLGNISVPSRARGA